MRLFESNDLEKQRRRIGCTIENPAIYPALTAQENLEIYRIKKCDPILARIFRQSADSIG